MSLQRIRALRYVVRAARKISPRELVGGRGGLFAGVGRNDRDVHGRLFIHVSVHTVYEAVRGHGVHVLCGS